jgi:GNAT superfamily N-acetyltransferase
MTIDCKLHPVLQGSTNRAAYPLPRWVVYVNAPPSRFYMTDRDVRVAYANLAPSGTIWGVVVIERYRSQGYGRGIMGLMLEEAYRQGHPWVRVRVHESNTVAYRMYESMNFRIVRHGVDKVDQWTEMELEIDVTVAPAFRA